MRKKRILIWGVGHDFCKLKVYFQKEVDQGNIQILAIVDHQTTKISPWNHIPVIAPIFIKKYIFEYVVITSTKYFFDIRMELINMGIGEGKIVDGAIFCLPEFDFYKFYRMDRLGERIVLGRFQDNTYADLVRIYRKNNITIKLGKKSYVADSYFEGDVKDALPSQICIGNYTAISWEVCWEVGLNLDHNYHRVCNYGVTHISDDYKKIFTEVYFGDDTIHIGSDVWIGRGSHIKSGLSIGDGAVIAANSVVVNNVEPYAVVGGNPARFIKYRFDRDIIKKLETIQWWQWDCKKIQANLSYFKDVGLFTDHFYLSR